MDIVKTAGGLRDPNLLGELLKASVHKKKTIEEIEGEDRRKDKTIFDIIRNSTTKERLHVLALSKAFHPKKGEKMTEALKLKDDGEEVASETTIEQAVRLAEDLPVDNPSLRKLKSLGAKVDSAKNKKEIYACIALFFPRFGNEHRKVLNKMIQNFLNDWSLPSFKKLFRQLIIFLDAKKAKLQF